MLAIITVIYRNYEILHDFIESLARQDSPFFTVYFIDLTEADRREVIPWIRKIEGRYSYITAENKGYAHGLNVGMAQASKDGKTHFALVNPDIVFDDHFVRSATQTLTQHPRTIIGGKIYYAKGYEYHINRYKPSELGHVLWFAGGHIHWAHATAEHVGVDEVDSPKYSIAGPTDFITGCLMLYDKTVHDSVGPWDESYFMYYEDTDFCVRATRLGVRIYYDPLVMIYHKNAQSTGGSGSKMQEQWMKKARIRFGMKYAPLRTKMHLLLNSLKKS